MSVGRIRCVCKNTLCAVCNDNNIQCTGDVLHQVHSTLAVVTRVVNGNSLFNVVMITEETNIASTHCWRTKVTPCDNNLRLVNWITLLAYYHYQFFLVSGLFLHVTKSL